MVKKKVVFFVSQFVGGAERITVTYAKLLNPELYDINFVIIGREKGDILKFIPKELNVDFIHIRNIYDFTTFKIFKYLKNKKPDIVFCSLIRLNTRVIAAAKMLDGIKVIVRNNIGLFRVKVLVDKILVKLFYPKADKIILQTPEMNEESLRWFESYKQFVTILNPIDKSAIDKNVANSSTPFDDNYKNFVFVGRIDYVKGLDVLLNAFIEVKKIICNARLYIVGKEGNHYDSLLTFVKGNNMEDYVFFTGFTTNPHKYIKYADSFVLPSRIEGMPNVVLDAMYLKVPVVVTRSVPIIESIVDANHGITVPVEDVQALSEGMIKSLSIKVDLPYINDSEKMVRKIFAEV